MEDVEQRVVGVMTIVKLVRMLSRMFGKNKQIVVTTIKAGQENKQISQSFSRTRVKQ